MDATGQRPSRPPNVSHGLREPPFPQGAPGIPVREPAVSERGYVLPALLVSLALTAAITAAAHGHLASLGSIFAASASELRASARARAEIMGRLVTDPPVKGTTCFGGLCRACANGETARTISPLAPLLDYDGLFAPETRCESRTAGGWESTKRRTALSGTTCTRIARHEGSRVIVKDNLDLAETLRLTGCDQSICVLASAGRLSVRELTLSGPALVIGGGGIRIGAVSVSSEASPSLPVPVVVDHPSGDLELPALPPAIRIMRVAEAREIGILPEAGCETLGFWDR